MYEVKINNIPQKGCGIISGRTPRHLVRPLLVSDPQVVLAGLVLQAL